MTKLVSREVDEPEAEGSVSEQQTLAIADTLIAFGGRSTNRTMYEEQMAATIVAQRQVLAKIAEGRGRYSRDQLTHADNTIEDMKKLATDALAGVYPAWDND